MRELNNIADIQSLIDNQVEESLHLDYKAADALGKSDGKKKEITKDVSAFANSDGGIIVYGIKEFNLPEKKHLPELIDPIDRQSFSKEWLEHVINNISPKIENFTITPIPLNKSSNDVVFVVAIKKSTTAHQATDCRYYKRYNFESIMMYDFEIRDIMNRNKFPKIELLFNIEQYTFEVEPHFSIVKNPNPFRSSEPTKKEIKTTNTLSVYGFNAGGVYTNYVNCILEIPTSIIDESEYLDKYMKGGIEYCQIYCDNTFREIKEITYLYNTSHTHYWPSRYEPILPGTRSRLKQVILKAGMEIDSGIIYWHINADNSEKREGEINVQEIEKSQRTKE